MQANKKMNINNGFTLVELIIVIAILAVIAAIAVPNLLGAIEDSRYTADIANGEIIAKAAQLYSAEKGGLSGTDLEVADSTTEPMKSILAKLDGQVPKPKSAVMKAGGTSFYVTVDTVTNKVIVTAGKHATGREVYPYPVDKEGNPTR